MLFYNTLMVVSKLHNFTATLKINLHNINQSIRNGQRGYDVEFDLLITLY